MTKHFICDSFHYLKIHGDFAETCGIFGTLSQKSVFSQNFFKVQKRSVFLAESATLLWFTYQVNIQLNRKIETALYLFYQF